MTRHYAFYERNGGLHGLEATRPLSIKNLMTIHPYSLTPDDRVLDAMNLIRDRDVRHIPIVDPATQRLVGLVTEVDILRNVLHGQAMTPEEDYHASLDMMLPLSRVMVRHIHSLHEDDAVMEAVAMFMEYRIRCAPVVDRDGCLKGIVTESDLMRLLSHMVDG